VLDLKVEITDLAAQKITEQGTNLPKNILLLEYETDGCGCVVNGVSTLVEIAEDDLTDQEIVLDTEPKSFRVAIQKRVEWVYDDEVKIDYSDTANILQLKSPNQMLNPRMAFKALKTT
jgi:uncharacterized protein YqkB